MLGFQHSAPRRSRLQWFSLGLTAAWLATLFPLARVSARGAEAVPRPIPVVDLHVDLPYQYGYKSLAFATGTGQYPASALLRAGVVGVVLPLFVPARVRAAGPNLEDLDLSYSRVIDAIRRNPPYAGPGCGDEPQTVRTWLALEGAGQFAGHEDQLRSWTERGLRSLGLVHSRNNALASSSGDPNADAYGLSDAGRRVVREAHKLGVVIDVSHASDAATREILALAAETRGVVMATHSNARSLVDIPRNLDDSLARGIAGTGGVIGVNFHSPFLRSSGRASIADVVRHVRHWVDVVGVEHVAIGSDFEGDIRPPRDLTDARGFPRLATALMDSGLSRESVERIFSGNALRVLCRSAGP